MSHDALSNNILPKLKNFYDSVESHDNNSASDHILYPNHHLSYLSNPDKKSNKGWAFTNRLFKDYEVSFLIALVEASPFLDSKSAFRFVERLRSLYSPTGRILREEYDKGSTLDNSSAIDHIPMGVQLEKGSSTRGKRNIEDFTTTLQKLDEAITYGCTVSFNYQHYVPRLKGNPSAVLVNHKGKLGHLEGLTPYCLNLMSGHYYLLTDRKDSDGDKNAFSIYRVDLITNVELCNQASQEGSMKPRKLVKEFDENGNEVDPIQEFFKGAFEGFGGKREAIELHCTKYAFHYIAERFSEFPDFKVQLLESTQNASGHAPAHPKTDQASLTTNQDTLKNGIDRKYRKDPLVYKVTFQAQPRGIEIWAMRFLRDIKLVKPATSMSYIQELLKDNLYSDLE